MSNGNTVSLLARSGRDQLHGWRDAAGIGTWESFICATDWSWTRPVSNQRAPDGTGTKFAADGQKYEKSPPVWSSLKLPYRRHNSGLSTKAHCPHCRPTVNESATPQLSECHLYDTDMNATTWNITALQTLIHARTDGTLRHC